MSGPPVLIPVTGGAIPTFVLGPADPTGVPALVVVPSIYGPGADLLDRLAVVADRCSVLVPDPFWRTGEGALPYGDLHTALARLEDFDPTRTQEEVAAVVEWGRARGNGAVVGLGICFGGPFVVHQAASGGLDGVVTWHGSRLEHSVDDLGRVACPLRLHFGGDDPVTPPDAIDAVRTALRDHPDAEVVVLPGARHGYSHDGEAFDAAALERGLAAVAEVVAGARPVGPGPDPSR